MIIDAQSVILGGLCTGSMMVLGGYAFYQVMKAPAPPPWRPQIVRDAMRFARFQRLAQFRARAFVPQRIVRSLRRRRDYEFCPLPLILSGYFED